MDVEPGPQRWFDNVGGVPLRSLRREVDVDDAGCGIPDRLTHTLGSLDDEAAGALTHRPLRQTRDGPDPIGSGVGQHASDQADAASA